MKRNLMEFLFGESQVDEEIAAIVEDIEDMDTEGATEIKVEKAPLEKALKSIGIDAGSLESDPRGLSLVLGDGDEYRAAHAILNEPDSLHKLASAGWVYSLVGDVAMANEPAEFRIRFLEINEPNLSKEEPKPTKGTAHNTTISATVKKGREWATTQARHDKEMNPVEFDDKTSSDHHKGVGKEKDGAQPEGKPKGSTKEAKEPAICVKCHKPLRYDGQIECQHCGKVQYSEALAKTKKKGLVQPKEGDKAKMTECPTCHTPCKHGTLWCKNCGSDIGGPDDGPSDMFTLPGEGQGVGEARTTKPHCKYCGSLSHTSENCPLGSASRSKKAKDKDVEEAKARSKTCKHCTMMAVNGVWTHEQGCPNARGEMDEGKHKSGCTCGFCKNKGNIHKRGEKPNDDEDSQESTYTGSDFRSESAAEIVGQLLDSNPGTPPGIMGTHSFPGMKVPGGSRDRKFSPAKGMVQPTGDEGGLVSQQAKRKSKSV